MPGSEAAMDPAPDYGEATYTGHGRLEGRIASSLLEAMVIGIDMRTQALGSGKVGVLVEAAPGARIEPRDLAVIREELSAALEVFNLQLQVKGRDRGLYYSDGVR